MYQVKLSVIEVTMDGGKEITDPNEIMKIVGLNPKNGFKGIAFQSEWNDAGGIGVVLDKKGHYKELPNGYQVIYEEVPYEGDEY